MKGFIGPLGDDLPSVLMIVLALGLFFTSILFTFNTYNEKISKLRMMEGAMEVGRVITEKGIFTTSADYQTKVNAIKNTYGLKKANFDVGLICGSRDYSLIYLVPFDEGGTLKLKKLVLCIE
jgi:hypothetical protein